MTIKLQNTITGKFYANGAWASDIAGAEVIERGSPVHVVIRHTWDMTYVIEVDDGYERGLALLEKAKRIREGAGCNRATNSRNARVERMLIGRADAIEVRARMLMGGN